MTTPASTSRYTPRIGNLRLGLLLSSLLLLVATGALWLWAEYGYVPADEQAWQPWDIKHYAMVVHAAFALLFVFLAGSLLQTHMQLAWQQARNRSTGAVMAVVTLVLAVSGFGLWYAGDDGLRRLSEIAHWVTGFGLPLLAAVHARIGRRRTG